MSRCDPGARGDLGEDLVAPGPDGVEMALGLGILMIALALGISGLFVPTFNCRQTARNVISTLNGSL
jgi:hypothetical protein